MVFEPLYYSDWLDEKVTTSFCSYGRPAPPGPNRTIVGILTCMSGKNSILGLSEPNKLLNFLIFHTYEDLKFHV